MPSLFARPPTLSPAAGGGTGSQPARPAPASQRRGARAGSRRSDDAAGAELLDLGQVVACFPEDVLRVLAEHRRWTVDGGAPVREPEARADQLHRTEPRLHRLQHVSVLELRVLDDLLDLPNGGARYVGLRESLLPRLGVVTRQRALDDLAERREVRRAGRPVLEARVLERIRAPDGGHEPDPLRLGQDREHEEASFRLEAVGGGLPAHRAVANLPLLDAGHG